MILNDRMGSSPILGTKQSDCIQSGHFIIQPFMSPVLRVFVSLLVCFGSAGATPWAGMARENKEKEQLQLPSALPELGRPTMTAEEKVEVLKNVNISDKLSKELPLELEFTDEQGKNVKLGDYFGKGRPVALGLSYYTCPNLCNFFTGGVVKGFDRIELKPGEDYEVVIVSIDPRDTPENALGRKNAYLSESEKNPEGRGWHFLSGKQAEIKILASTVGFSYEWDEKTQQYAHGAALMLATPEGILSKYLYGISFKERDLRLAVVEAGRGMIGTSLDRFMLYCFRWDSNQGQYTVTSFMVMQAGGAMTVLFLFFLIGGLMVRERKRKKNEFVR